VGCSECKLNGACSLPDPLDQALAAFFAVLERYTLADVMGDKAERLLARLN
jgi:Rrf2 family nitric oxide-sensitive transcriptional repressor